MKDQSLYIPLYTLGWYWGDTTTEGKDYSPMYSHTLLPYDNVKSSSRFVPSSHSEIKQSAIDAGMPLSRTSCPQGLLAEQKHLSGILQQGDKNVGGTWGRDSP